MDDVVAFATPTKTTLTVNLESTYDWHAGHWTVPVNFMVSQLLRVGKLPLGLQVGARYYAESPSSGRLGSALHDYSALSNGTSCYTPHFSLRRETDPDL